MTPARRQRIRDELVMAFTTLANRVADILDEAGAANDGDAAAATPARRRTPQRRPFVPSHDQAPSDEARAKARAGARRAGVRIP